MAENRFTLVFVGAIITAAAATFGVYRVLETSKAESRIPTRVVVVAAKDLREGIRIEKEMLTVKEWPAATVPDSAFVMPDSLVGRITRVAVFTGEAVVAGRLAPIGAGAGIELKITPGKRAMAVRINDVAGVAGLVQPNARVDVLVTLRDEVGGGRQVTKLFMENMRVLSVGTQVDRGQDGTPIDATTATLEVTPSEAERLALAVNSGSIQLVLRGFGDPDSSATTGAHSSDVLAELRAAPEPEPRPQPAAPRAAPRRSAPTPSAAPAPAPPVAVAPAPAPDTVAVTVYRGEKASQQKFVKADTTRRP